MSRYKQLRVPVDGTTRYARALDEAIALVLLGQARIRLVHVMDERSARRLPIRNLLGATAASLTAFMASSRHCEPVSRITSTVVFQSPP